MRKFMVIVFLVFASSAFANKKSKLYECAAYCGGKNYAKTRRGKTFVHSFRFLPKIQKRFGKNPSEVFEKLQTDCDILVCSVVEGWNHPGRGYQMQTACGLYTQKSHVEFSDGKVYEKNAVLNMLFPNASVGNNCYPL